LYAIQNPLRFVDPLGLAGCNAAAKAVCDITPSTVFSNAPSNSGEIPQEAHERFQLLIDKYTSLVAFNEISACAAFARLFGRLYEITGRDDDWTSLYAIYYFTDYDYTVNGLFKKLRIPGVGPVLPWTNTWARPEWLSSHYNQGAAQGYIQLDTDTGGRHDHFLSNLYAIINGGAIGLVGALHQQKGEPSESDRRANVLGRELASTMKAKLFEPFPKGIGSKMSGEEISKWIYENLCHEDKKEGCAPITSGPITDEKAKKLIGRVDELRKLFGPMWEFLPWPSHVSGLPTPIK